MRAGGPQQVAEPTGARPTYEDQGFAVVPDVLGPEWLASATAEATAICRGRRGAIDGAVPADERDDDAAVLARYLCIHFPRKISAVMRELARHPAVMDALVDAKDTTDVVRPWLRSERRAVTPSGAPPARSRA